MTSVSTERALVSTISDQQSPSLSLTNIQANNVKVSETSTRNSRGMNKTRQMSVVLSKGGSVELRKQKTSAFSLWMHLDCWSSGVLFEAISLICLLPWSGRGLLDSVCIFPCIRNEIELIFTSRKIEMLLTTSYSQTAFLTFSDFLPPWHLLFPHTLPISSCLI